MIKQLQNKYKQLFRSLLLLWLFTFSFNLRLACSTSAWPTLRVFKWLRRKCNDICTRLDILETVSQPLLTYRKIPKINSGAYIFQRPFLRGLSTEGNLRFKIDWASLIVGRKFTVFALFYFVFAGNFPSTSPGGLIFGGAIYRRVFALPDWGAYILRGLYMEGLIFGILQHNKLYGTLKNLHTVSKE